MVRIMLDPGHGGRDPGAVAHGLKEKDLTLDIARRIKKLLASDYDGITVYMTRDADRDVSLTERTTLANQLAVDLFLSLHINAGGGTGFESYIFPDSGQKTQTMQAVLHDAIVEKVGPGVRNRGKKRGNFAVLRLTKMPALLTENLFIDHPEDAALLRSADFLTRLAQGYVSGIAACLRLRHKETNPGNSSSSTAGYRLLTGTFSRRQDAEQAAETLRKQFGWTVYIVDG